jgi:DMSO reductase anchor subunit
MKKSLKGALLSAIVYPGVGQLWLKCYFRGLALIIAVSASLTVIAMKAMQQAYSILEKIETEGGKVDLAAILSQTSRASVTPDDFMTKAASTMLVLCWIIGIVDAYMVGRKRELTGISKGHGP